MLVFSINDYCRGHKVLASHIESLLECLTKYKERFNKDNFRHQTIYHARSQPACSTESDATLQLIHETPDVNGMYKELDKEIQTAPNSLDEF